MFVFKLSLCLGLLFSTCLAQDSLSRYNVDSERITVSGISAGAAFATQFHVAFSSNIQGVGLWAGVPYLCFIHWYYGCMYTPSLIIVSGLVRDTELLADLRRIDVTQNLQDDKVYIFHGTQDTTVMPGASDAIYEFYQEFVDDVETNIVLKNDLGATHAVVSDHVGTDCGVRNEELYVENCDFDSIFAMLNHMYGGGLTRPEPPYEHTGSLISFDQDEFFFLGAGTASMDEIGFIYVPLACQGSDSQQCLFHVHFHGCTMEIDVMGTEYMEEAGFLEIADANNIVILFPQTSAKAVNPGGCFNWFGYNGDLLFETYATKDAVQMDGVFQMVQRVAGI